MLIVCTVHRPSGVATAAELHWLLERLRPDVLFLEHSSTDFSTFLDGSCGTLESAAVRLYRTVHRVELVPVDLHLQAADLKQKFDEMFDRIKEASPRYCQLQLVSRQHTERGGLAFLNCPTSAMLQSEIQREMRATVEAIGDPDLAALYELWTSTHEMRELAMLSKVEAFARQASFTKGVLLVGAGHCPSLFEKSRLQSDGPSAVQWDFEWQFEEEALDQDAGPADDITDRGALGQG